MLTKNTIKRMFLCILSCILLGCVGCSDENANDPFSGINWGNEMELPAPNEPTGSEDDSNDSSSPKDEDSSSKEEAKQEDKNWTRFY